MYNNKTLKSISGEKQNKSEIGNAFPEEQNQKRIEHKDVFLDDPKTTINLLKLYFNEMGN